ncbi:hypothetical protein T01_11390 [Trichinella spiralis]|uniref:Uncharacterized protein n=1 Tax=Trichinella spiralis TaxID=6334 RepID=A0A0V1B9J2_TRISP|nr:hypothetical protein T01_11390 [Trichinella spiralis]
MGKENLLDKRRRQQQQQQQRQAYFCKTHCCLSLIVIGRLKAPPLSPLSIQLPNKHRSDLVGVAWEKMQITRKLTERISDTSE